MELTIQQCAIAIFISFLALIALTALIVIISYIIRRCAAIGYHRDDFERLNEEARDLRRMTLRVRRDFDIVRRVGNWKESSGNGTGTGGTGSGGGFIEGLEVLDQAEDWDNSIRIALRSWQDIMEPTSEIDIEAQTMTSLGSKVEKKRRLRHGKWLVEVLREKVREGIERRRELTYPLHKLQLELHEMYKDQDGGRGGGKGSSEEGDVSEVVCVHKRNISSEEHDLGSDSRSGQVVYTSISEQRIHTTTPSKATILTHALKVTGDSS